MNSMWDCFSSNFLFALPFLLSWNLLLLTFFSLDAIVPLLGQGTTRDEICTHPHVRPKPIPRVLRECVTQTFDGDDPAGLLFNGFKDTAESAPAEALTFRVHTVG